MIISEKNICYKQINVIHLLLQFECDSLKLFYNWLIQWGNLRQMLLLTIFNWKNLPKNRFINSEGDNLSANTFMNCSVQSEILRRNSFMNTELNWKHISVWIYMRMLLPTNLNQHFKDVSIQCKYIECTVQYDSLWKYVLMNC